VALAFASPFSSRVPQGSFHQSSDVSDGLGWVPAVACFRLQRQLNAGVQLLGEQVDGVRGSNANLIVWACLCTAAVLDYGSAIGRTAAIVVVAAATEAARPATAVLDPLEVRARCCQELVCRWRRGRSVLWSLNVGNTSTVLVFAGLHSLPHHVRHVQRPFRWVSRVLLWRFEILLPLGEHDFEVLKDCTARYTLLPLQLLRVCISSPSSGPEVVFTVFAADVFVDARLLLFS